MNMDISMLQKVMAEVGGGNGNMGNSIEMIDRVMKLQKLMGNGNENMNGMNGKRNDNENAGGNGVGDLEEQESFGMRESMGSVNGGSGMESLKLGDRREQMLYSALPFVQEKFRGGIFNLTKILEVQRVLGRKEEDVMLNARESGGVSEEGGSPIDMLNAIKPFLHSDEQKQLDMVVRLIGVGGL